MATATKKSEAKTEKAVSAQGGVEVRELTDKGQEENIKAALKNGKAVREQREGAIGADGVYLDSFTRRFGDDILFGHFVSVGAGPHKGDYGVYEKTVSTKADGYPDEILVRSRDTDERFVVKADDCSKGTLRGR